MSVSGAYVVGRSSVASSLLAQTELLDLALGLERAIAEHGIAWAQLERVVGRSVGRSPAPQEDETRDRNATTTESSNQSPPGAAESQ